MAIKKMELASTQVVASEYRAVFMQGDKDHTVHRVPDTHGRIEAGEADGAIAMCGCKPMLDYNLIWRVTDEQVDCLGCLRAMLAEAQKPGWFLPLDKVNDLQAQSIDHAIEDARGAHYTNLMIRKDGQDIPGEADWLKHLKRV